MNTRTIRRMTVIVGSALLYLAWDHFTISSDHEGRVRWWHRTTVWSILHVHISATKVIEVDGVEYHDVLGEAPFYLSVKASPVIMFAQGYTPSVRLHTYNLETREHHKMLTPETGVGLGFAGNDSRDKATLLPNGNIELTAMAKSYLIDIKNEEIIWNRRP